MSANGVTIAFVASYLEHMELFTTCAVAPRAGAWIETHVRIRAQPGSDRRPPQCWARSIRRGRRDIGTHRRR